jgi:hypothetical protein
MCDLVHSPAPTRAPTSCPGSGRPVEGPRGFGLAFGNLPTVRSRSPVPVLAFQPTGGPPGVCPFEIRGNEARVPLSVADDTSGFGGRRSVRSMEGLQTEDRMRPEVQMAKLCRRAGARSCGWLSCGEAPVEVLHRKVPIARPGRRTRSGPPALAAPMLGPRRPSITFRPLRFVAVAKTLEVSLADP